MILKDLRSKWEKGLTPKTVIDDTLADGMGAVLVILKDPKYDSYHLHRYVRVGEAQWEVSVDSRNASPEDVLRWLNDPSPRSAREFDEVGQKYEVDIPEPYANEVPQEA